MQKGLDVLYYDATIILCFNHTPKDISVEINAGSICAHLRSINVLDQCFDCTIHTKFLVTRMGQA